jgi:competence protein ComEA
MVGLAAIGANSTLAGGGVSVTLPSARAAPSTSGVWMPPDPPAPTSTPSAASNGSPEPSPPASPGITADGKVILNVANADELSKLPRVGAKRAGAIVALRQKLGKFKRATDLLRVKGIGQKTLKLMLPRLVLDPPAGP